MREISDILNTGKEIRECMLPPWIIEQIRKREKEERPKDDRPALRLPHDKQEPDYQRRDHPDDEDENRGVVVIELCRYDRSRYN
jgi:hypothetical protein